MNNWQPKTTMLVGRTVAALLLIAALFQPDNLPDVSLSVLVQDSGIAGSGAARVAARSIIDDTDQYGDEIHVRVPDPDVRSTGQSMSDLLTKALWNMTTDTRNAVVLVSDGRWPASIAPLLTRTAAANMPVYWLPVDDVSDARIISVMAPPRAQPGHQIAVTVTSIASETEAYEIRIYANDTMMGRSSISDDEVTTVDFVVPAAGAISLDVEIYDPVNRQTVARLDAAAIINIVAPPRLLVISSGATPIGQSLAAGEWSVTRISPQQFPAYVDSLQQFGAVVLDDVSVTAIPEAGWRAIATAVRQDALGLLVLGGPDSFARGAYRGSTLENLLPVLSEPPDAEKPAALAFMVDVSGSMDSSGLDTLSIARTAVIETVTALRPLDRVGLIAFDVTAQELLPIAARNDHANAIERAWPARASGGTRVEPAIELALAAITAQDVEQRVLILVTDGMLSDTDVEKLELMTSQNSIEFIGMIVSTEATTTPLVARSAGDRLKLLVVDDVLRMPVLMREELESRRPAVVRDRVSPATGSLSLPGDVATDWPALTAYALTRARPEAAVLLRSPQGDPLFASWTVGTGRVAALTGGLNAWAEEWIRWENWPQLAAYVVSAVVAGDPMQARVSIEYVDHYASAIIIDSGQDLSAMPRPQIAMPDGDIISVAVEPIAPDRYAVTLPQPGAGEHVFVWQDGTGLSRYHFLAETHSKASTEHAPIAQHLLDNGVLQEWTANSANEVASQASYKAVLTILALFVFLATMAAHRSLLAQWAGRSILELFRLQNR